MPGNKTGGQKTAETIRRRFGADYYQKLGQRGGKAGRTGGFYRDPERASQMGTIGGAISKHGYRFVERQDNIRFYEHKATGAIVPFEV